jgi:hypothetical protein
MLELATAFVVGVVDEAARVVDNQLRAVHQRQPPRRRIAKKLVADSTLNQSDDFARH